ncbi:sulfite exporter TauE/SafE family protein [Chitinophaga sp.]|uniref:sulfite exporter TauE/SafE family protein n=1 Tax=Chitinophaga sp. TaxID=1869181 RepID=UPI0031DB3083
MDNYLAFILLALLSEVIGTISGFGSSILFVPIASLFFDFKSVLGITAVFHVFSNLSKIYLFRQGIDKNVAVKLGIPAIVFVILGAWLTTYIPAKPLELLMSCALIGLSVYLLVNFNHSIRQSNSNLFSGGAASGFLAGIAGTGGAIRGITLAAFHLPKMVFIATSALIDLGVDSSRAFIYIHNGYFSRKYIVLIPFLIVISIVGSYLGKIILRYTSEIVFRYLVLLVVMTVSIYQIFKLFR